MTKPQTDLFNRTGAFFAFSDKQFNEQKKEGVKYAQLPSGLIVPKKHVQTVITELEMIFKRAMKQDLKENGKEAIIRRELNNHECVYTMSIEDALPGLLDYGFTEVEVQQVYVSIINPALQRFEQKSMERLHPLTGALLC